MPRIEDVTDSIAQLAKVKLVNLSVSPSTIRPFESSTISWRVDLHGVAGVSLRLIGVGANGSINPVGSRRVAPLVPARYEVQAIRTGVSTTLGSVSLDVDLSECRTGSISEDLVRVAFAPIIQDVLQDKPEIRRRRPDSIEVESVGIRLALRWTAEIEYWADPDINVDALIQLRAEEGRIAYTLASYGFEIDFPWYADFATGLFFPAWLARALEEGSRQGETLDRLTRGIDRALASVQASVEDEGLRFISVWTVENTVNYTACPINNPVWSGGLTSDVKKAKERLRVAVGT